MARELSFSTISVDKSVDEARRAPFILLKYE
jgi:hypothetical protein